MIRRPPRSTQSRSSAASDVYKRQDLARNFIGGQLAHGRKMCAVLNSWPNSFKRLVPGYEAPVYLAWAHKNRSPLIRVPNFGGRKGAARCEIRCPDAVSYTHLRA